MEQFTNEEVTAFVKSAVDLISTSRYMNFAVVKDGKIFNELNYYQAIDREGDLIIHKSGKICKTIITREEKFRFLESIKKQYGGEFDYRLKFPALLHCSNIASALNENPELSVVKIHTNFKVDEVDIIPRKSTLADGSIYALCVFHWGYLVGKAR